MQSPGGLGAEEASVSIHKFLPATSLSTLGLLALLLRWATSPPNRCGLREADRRAAATGIINGLLASAAAVPGAQWRLTFEVVGEWACSWSRRVMQKTALVLEVTADAQAGMKVGPASGGAHGDLWGSVVGVLRLGRSSSGSLLEHCVACLASEFASGGFGPALGLGIWLFAFGIVSQPRR